MKIIAIGDIHGKDSWKRIVAKKNLGDIVVFIGDYLDSFDIGTSRQIENFKQILDFKRNNLDSCVLLIGNHDFHYMEKVGEYERYSGFNPKTKEVVSPLLEKALEEGLLQMAYEKDRYLFTHAGVTKAWLTRAGLESSTNVSIVDDINNLFKKDIYHFRFAVGTDPTGDDPRSSPIWVRPESLRESQVEGMHQVIGHTRYPSIAVSVTSPNLIFIDVLDQTEEYLEIENGGIKTMKI